MLAQLIRSAPRQQTLVRARAIHASASARSAHGHYHHLPFQLPGDKKAAFGAKLMVYLSVGFSIPFIASYYQLKKSAGAA
ncbi:hypothetical protein BDQ12DRAFT_718819 [Crucibulum laeve]|uniref:Cytochrome c oxidase subunit 8, mitochondrial n=1 Tax=Crucibulum laeve TaxID=68775 RepID=A0A5C3MEG0_9AGAR|nr:hypothetical protein BDQ12DRAFT_718819 [Crucibulum laeve]